jgi:hypothetical protein
VEPLSLEFCYDLRGTEPDRHDLDAATTGIAAWRLPRAPPALGRSALAQLRWLPPPLLAHLYRGKYMHFELPRPGACAAARPTGGGQLDCSSKRTQQPRLKRLQPPVAVTVACSQSRRNDGTAALSRDTSSRLAGWETRPARQTSARQRSEPESMVSRTQRATITRSLRAWAVRAPRPLAGPRRNGPGSTSVVLPPSPSLPPSLPLLHTHSYASPGQRPPSLPPVSSLAR